MEKDPKDSNEVRSLRDHKIDALLRVFHGEQKKVGEFRHKKEWRASIKAVIPNIDDETIDASINQDGKLANKKGHRIERSDSRDYEGEEMRKYEAVLEGLIHYSATQGVIFRQSKIAELGSDFDDKYHGSDVIFGLKDENGNTQVFSVDAYAGESPQGIDGKFQKSRDNSAAYTPGCNQIRYCYYSEQDQAAGRTEHYRYVPFAPHYIVGVSKSTICRELDNQLVLEGGGLTYEFIGGTVSEEFRKKILTQIYMQSRASYLSTCNFINEPPESASKGQLRTAKLAKMQHKLVADSTRLNLMSLFGVKKDDPEAREKLDKEIENFAHMNADDFAFSGILSTATADYHRAKGEFQSIKERRDQAFGQKASELNEKLDDDKKDSDKKD